MNDIVESLERDTLVGRGSVMLAAALLVAHDWAIGPAVKEAFELYDAVRAEESARDKARNAPREKRGK